MAQREKSKEHDILKAATEMFTEKGFHKATIEDIAERAGIGKGTVYEYFKNKTQLFEKMLDYNLEQYHSCLEKNMEGTSQFKEKLYTFIDFHHALIKDSLQAVTVLFHVTVASSMDEETKKSVHNILNSSRLTVIEMLVKTLEAGKLTGKITCADLSFAADIFYAMVIRCCLRPMQFCLSEEQYETEKQRLVEMLLSGIGRD